MSWERCQWGREKEIEIRVDDDHHDDCVLSNHCIYVCMFVFAIESKCIDGGADGVDRCDYVGGDNGDDGGGDDGGDYGGGENGDDGGGDDGSAYDGEVDDDCFYIALFSALEQTHCARM